MCLEATANIYLLNSCHIWTRLFVCVRPWCEVMKVCMDKYGLLFSKGNFASRPGDVVLRFFFFFFAATFPHYLLLRCYPISQLRLWYFSILDTSPQPVNIKSNRELNVRVELEVINDLNYILEFYFILLLNKYELIHGLFD